MGKGKKSSRFKISLNSSLNFQWNEQYNDNPEILDILAKYFEENGFKKNKSNKKNMSEDERSNENKNFTVPYEIRSSKAVFGLKQVLKLENINKLSCILLDSSIISHQAISTVLGIKLNLSSRDRCPVYCISNLSSTLSKKLNYSNISVIGLLSRDEELFSNLENMLKKSGVKINPKTEIITKEITSKNKKKK
uniref:Ribosomal_L7Ae domain-containing protein n=1 Tax=Strongyloides papillosus TaxID=174720 RepID=A0A0N5BY42_STREA